MTIDTPPPSAAADAIAARTVVQPDGDVLCLVANPSLGPDLVAAHGAQVAAWFASFETTLGTADATLKKGGLWLCGLIAGLGSLAAGMVRLTYGAAVLVLAPILLAAGRHAAARFVVGSVRSHHRS